MMPGARMTEAEFADRAKPKKKPAFKLTAIEPTEASIQKSILRALKIHPAVAFSWRQNTGAMVVGEGRLRRFVRFGPKGQPDIQGYLTNGVALFIECKRRSGKVTPEQQEFIDRASNAGSVAFVARSVADVFAVLDGIQHAPIKQELEVIGYVARGTEEAA